MTSTSLATRFSSLPHADGAMTRPARLHEPARPGRVRFSYLLGLLVLLGAIAAGLHFARPDLVDAVLHRPHLEAWFMVKSAPPALVEKPTAPPSKDEFRLFLRTQAELIKSPLVLIAALRNLNDFPTIAAQQDPIQWLQDNIRVDAPGDSELMRVSMRRESEESVKILEAVVNAYRNEVVDREKMLKSENFDVLSQSSESLRQQIVREQENYKRLTELMGIIPADGVKMASEISLRSIDNLDQELRDLKKTRTTKSLELTAAEERANQAAKWSVPEHQLQQELGKDPELAIRLPRLIELQAQLASARLSTLDSQAIPDVERLTQLVELEQKSIVERTAQLQPSIEAALRARTIHSDSGSVQQLALEVSMLDELVASTQADRHEMQEQLNKLNRTSPDLQASQGRIEQLEYSYKQVASEVRALEVELKAPPRVQLIQKPI